MERMFSRVNAELERSAQQATAKPAEEKKTAKDIITQVLEAFEKKDYFT